MVRALTEMGWSQVGGWGRLLAIVAIAVAAFLLWSVWTIGGYVALAAMSCWYLSFAVLMHDPDSGLFSKWGGLGRALAILAIATAAVLLWWLWTIAGILALLAPIAYFVLMLSIAKWQTAHPAAAGGSPDTTPIGPMGEPYSSYRASATSPPCLPGRVHGWGRVTDFTDDHGEYMERCSHCGQTRGSVV